jgi:hypothetical protein
MDDLDDFRWNPPTLQRWVVVAGTGLQFGTPQKVVRTARAVGSWLARNRFGLVAGGWHGVDYLVTESFLHGLSDQDLQSKDHLIQVLTKDQDLLIPGGRVVRTDAGAREWAEPQRYADAVVLIGGLGGTYYTWLGALHDGLPRFPLGGTGGDAGRAFKETVDLWELIPVPGLTLREFEALGQAVRSDADADALASYLTGRLLQKSLAAADARSRRDVSGAPSIFISYSRRNGPWVDRLRTLFQPMERRGMLSTWSDADLEAGLPWEPQLLSSIAAARAALLLVTPALLASDYVKKVELPALLSRARAPATNFRLFWLLLEPCDWRSRLPELADVQAIGDLNRSVAESDSSADEQVRLIQVVEAIGRALLASPR